MRGVEFVYESDNDRERVLGLMRPHREKLWCVVRDELMRSEQPLEEVCKLDNKADVWTDDCSALPHQSVCIVVVNFIFSHQVRDHKGTRPRNAFFAVDQNLPIVLSAILDKLNAVVKNAFNVLPRKLEIFGDFQLEESLPGSGSILDDRIYNKTPQESSFRTRQPPNLERG